MTPATVLVTGVCGFLGRYVAQSYASSGLRVIGIDSCSPENAPAEVLHEYRSGRLPDEPLLQWIANSGCDLVVHCAGRASVKQSMLQPRDDYEANADLTFRLLDCLRTVRRECRFILLSSAAVYGNPTRLPVTEDAEIQPLSPYGFHKRMAELVCEQFARIHGVRTASLRIFSAYGAGLRRQVCWDVVNKFSRSERVLLLGNGTETRDFVHAEDVAQAISIIAERADMNGETYNVASGEEIPIRRLAEIVAREMDSQKPIEFDGTVPPGNPTRWRADISRIQRLGYQPAVPFDQGIREYITWCRPLLHIR